MLCLLAVTLLNQFVVVGPQRPSEYLWQTSEVLGRGVDRTFLAHGTRRGNRYRFKASGVCTLEPVRGYFLGRGPLRPIHRHSASSIFGIDFKVQFGDDPRQVLNVGTSVPEQTAIDFIADRDDAPIRIFDNWDLPKGVRCTIDSIEVVSAPLK